MLAYIIHLVVKKLNETFKETFNETFTSQLKPSTKQHKEINRETAKVIKDNFKKKLKKGAVES